MLNTAKALQGYSLQNIEDETIGKIKEFYFDDHHWTVRYLVADTGNWLTGRQVLISPYALVAVNSDHRNIVLDLTKKQIEASPPLDSDKPVSRQFEQAYYGHYGWPMYWNGPYVWGPSRYLTRDPEQWKTCTQREKECVTRCARAISPERSGQLKSTQRRPSSSQMTCRQPPASAAQLSQERQTPGWAKEPAAARSPIPEPTFHRAKSMLDHDARAGCMRFFVRLRRPKSPARTSMG